MVRGLATRSDLDQAVRECREHIERIGHVDAIGSFSLGGSLAVRLITEVVHVPAVMIAPPLRSAVVEAALPHAAGADIHIVTGEHDQFREGTIERADALRAAGRRSPSLSCPTSVTRFPMTSIDGWTWCSTTSRARPASA